MSPEVRPPAPISEQWSVREPIAVTPAPRALASESPSLAAKHVKPHTLRHAAAMALLQRGVDLSVIALWLGHESTETTQIYLHADMRLKLTGPPTIFVEQHIKIFYSATLHG